MPDIYNFSAGPATLPHAVMQQIQMELLDWQRQGVSVMEISHRSDVFMAMVQQAEKDLRDLLNIPKNYQVLFLPGGATYQFAQIPLNLLGDKQHVDYVDTGIWSQKAIAEAKRYAQVNVVASSADSNYTNIPAENTWLFNSQAAYLHYVANETISGVEFHWVPQTNAVPLVVDMSSNILSKPIDINQFGLIYAGAQKNIGPSGLTLVIVREDLFGKASTSLPTLLNYQVQAQNHSMYNTPPTFAWYVAALVFQWLKQQGGLCAIEKINQRKAEKLYCYLDQSEFYHNDININCRSIMNVTFRLSDAQQEEKFLLMAQQAGLIGLRGHRLRGGIRASIYNAMPESGVDALIEFMHDFSKIKN